MKLAGQALLHAPLDRVWTALRDPAVLASTIPGCERLTETGPDSYAMTVTAGVASIKGSYAGTVALAQLPEPNSFLLKASGAGGPGTVNADVTVMLTSVGNETQLDYQADAAVGGVIGGVGQRMLAGVAKKLAGEFFAAVDDVLTGKKQPAVAQSGTAQIGTASSGAPQSGPQPVSAQPNGHQPSGPLVFGTGAGFRPATAGNSFVLGAVFGAAAALLGVLVGARTARTGLNARTS